MALPSATESVVARARQGVPIRVLFPFVGGDTVGGSHVSSLGLVAALDQRMVDVRILLLNGTGKLADYITGLGLEYQHSDAIGILAPRGRATVNRCSPLQYLTSTVPQLMRYIRDNKIDIVHTNDGRMHANWALPTRLSGRKLIWHHREDPHSFGANTLAPFLASRVVSVSEFARPARPLLPISSRTTVVRSPFVLSDRPDRAPARLALLQEIGATPDAVLLGYFGSLVPRKRPLDFVRAVEATAKALPGRDVHGLLFGSAVLENHPLDEQAAALARDLGIADKVHLMGYRTPIAGPMAAMDATLVMAENEPFGRTLIEAMHLQVPVIATRNGGNTEAIRDGENGLLVELGDISAAGRAVARLCADPEFRERIVRKASTGLEAAYSTQRHVDEITRIYHRLVPSKGEMSLA